MPHSRFAFALLVFAASSALARDVPRPAVVRADAGVAAIADGPIRDPAGVQGYAVHEWGVFTIQPDLEMANAALAAEWAGCPRELYRTEPPNLRNLPWRGEVGKPLVYFHWQADGPPPEQGLTMKVRFPAGRPVIWWPASQEGEGNPHRKVHDSLSWRLYLRPSPDGPANVKPRAPAVTADHWYAKARMVKAEPVVSWGGHARGAHLDAEQFVYYDGLMTPLAFLRARRTATGNLVLDNTAPYPLHELWCVDHTGDTRTGPGPRLARVPLVPVGTKEIVPEWRVVPAADWAAATAEQFAADLEKTGLHADEARSLVAIWQPGFFHAPGLTLFYRLPQREYDRVTTIALDPVPETLVRVGIVLHAHAEPERAAAKQQSGGGAATPAELARPVGPQMQPLGLEKVLTVAEAEKLAVTNHDLSLFGLSSLAADVAATLAPHRHTLRAPGIVHLNAEVAAALARHVGPVDLPDLRRLESVDLARRLAMQDNAYALVAASEFAPDVAAALVSSEHWIGRQPRLAVLSPEVAAILAASRKWDGQLPGVTELTAADSVAVAAALATRPGVLALPNLKKISPKTLSALIEKQDVEIPRIETLELIPEPDGSPTDDFVVPEGFQQR
ncbi:hypothetical protein LBMAG47_00060 [Planctomycetia bacterium]|nr:hypothetical protein LBMAG47_00060 [Planctomycetia bacterium]